MKLPVLGIAFACAAFGQSPEASPSFEAADVHVSAKSSLAARNSPVRDGRYEIRNATMSDLIRFAYGFDADKILEGPNWLELDHFDISAKVPDDTSADTRKLMLQSLLSERFKLVVRKENRPLPTYALIAGKKPQLKEAGGSEENGCRPDSGVASGGTNGQIMIGNANGTATAIRFGPDMTIHYICRNVTLEEFAASMRGMIGNSLGTTVIDDTGIKGKWNFDLRYSLQFFAPAAANAPEHISFADAVEKQLGLKLEERPVSTPVLVVESVNRKPAENPAGTADILPPIVMPTEFEVASVKPTDPNSRGGRFQIQPGGRLVCEGMPLSFLMSRAFNTYNNEEVVGMPDSAASGRYDITAKLPSGGPQIGNADMETLAPMILALLKDRFKLEYHKEERSIAAYSLVASKPKMKKADPNSRIFCHNLPAPPGAPPGSRTFKCQNATMAMFAERLQNLASGLNWPILDGTGLEGGWDFALTFSNRPQMAMAGPGGGEATRKSVVPEASDPSDSLTIFEAIEKQLGLKLEKQKRSLPVVVIDHIEAKPTENCMEPREPRSAGSPKFT
jgi:uncharacterized protein (TIGR03435 family)